jgi:pimeloyl-ACP methyl ester carboxylesterase
MVRCVRARRSTVVADDGVPLAVTEFGDRAASLTVVFLHGHCLRTEVWSALCHELHGAHSAGDAVRMVCYDHRGHGSSGSAPAATYTIDQLAADLDVVLRTVVPRGPVVLVGHSMGAMTALAYLRAHPEVVGTRVAAVGLIRAVASGLTDSGLGRYLHHRAVAMLEHTARVAPVVLIASRRIGRSACTQITRHAGFGSRRTNPAMVALASAMINDTSPVTVSAFLGSLRTFDESATLSLLHDLPALVLVGSDDLMTPPSHSVEIAARLARAELVRLDGAGHSVVLERPAEVAAAVRRLLDRAYPKSWEYAFAG